jgi:RNA polymerase primary sigma factor
MRALKITKSITNRDQKSLEKYLSDIAKYDVLSPEEELELFKRYKSGDQVALEKIMKHNLRFVVSVAKQYQEMGMWLGDLINEGNIGMIKAAQRFDETKGFKFISYAVWWIRQSILQAINEKGRTIRLPLNVNSNTSKVMAKRRELLQTKEREPSIAELAKATGMSKEVVQKCLRSYSRTTSLDAPLNDDSDDSMINLMEDNNIAKPDYELVVEESRKKEVEHLINTLPPRQKTIIAMYFGIGRNRPSSLSDIADFFDLSRERVRQIKDRSLRKLRLSAIRHMPEAM